MKSKTLMPLLALALILMPIGLAAQSYQAPSNVGGFSGNSTIPMSFDGGQESKLSAAFSGMESTANGSGGGIVSGEFSGSLAVDGQTFKLPKDKGTVYHMDGHTIRFYKWEFKDHGRKYKMTLLLGHPEDPVYGRVSVVDYRNPTNVGSGNSTF